MAPPSAISPDFSRIRDLIVEADSFVEEIDDCHDVVPDLKTKLKSEGLNEDQVKLVVETSFHETPWELSPDEVSRYEKAGLDELAQILSQEFTTPSEGNPQIPRKSHYHYQKAAPYVAFIRPLAGDPTKFDTAYPNATAIMIGLDIAVGEESSKTLYSCIRHRPRKRLVRQGELHVQIEVGRSSDDFAPSELPISDAARMLLGNSKQTRSATINSVAVEYRHYFDRVEDLRPRLEYFNLYMNIGMRLMFTDTVVTTSDGDDATPDPQEHPSEIDPLGRVAFGMDAFRLNMETGGHLALYGEVGGQAGIKQAGPDSQIGLSFVVPFDESSIFNRNSRE